MSNKKLHPKILTHPNIPKPLHGINPRTIFGDDWWRIEKTNCYKSFDFCCAACGVHKSDALEHQWLEAHEYYKFNYIDGSVKFIKTVPLRHYCHNFIHSGRMAILIDKKQISTELVKSILSHGFNILKKNSLKCFPFTLQLANKLGVDAKNVKPFAIKANPNLTWKDWHLIIEGEKYYSKFKNKDEWIYFYSK